MNLTGRNYDSPCISYSNSEYRTAISITHKDDKTIRSKIVNRLRHDKLILPGPPKPNTICLTSKEPIDLVITWVNGTDPEFLKLLHEHVPEKAKEIDPRFLRDSTYSIC